ncbi:2OG-Fe(II) oxygenase [Pseudomonas vranovensis]|uniref:2OG-Fe(II) oxygenase n=1 Tax=Pseudomonas vranovensis TaxID=321661 RepID=UPI000F461CE2|nr:2OG-Fe(II) oxygenase [Pseudomonas vranovensis]
MNALHTATDSLRQWILVQRARQQSNKDILNQLLAYGWPVETIEAALAERSASTIPGPDLSTSPVYIDLGDRCVQVLHTMAHPHIVVFGDLLSAEECDGLISAARSRLTRSLAMDVETGVSSVSNTRTSDEMSFERGENALVSLVEQRIATLLRWPVAFAEGLHILRYSPGAEFVPHYDYFSAEGPGSETVLARGGQRIGTLLIYLQEPERGGSTLFPDVGFEVVPKRGCGVFFSYDKPDPSTLTLHGGAPVLAGEKWVATKWLHEREFT